MTNKVLRVGDPHIKIGNIQESEKLFDFIRDVAKIHDVGSIEILGDLFHTNAVKRVEVEEFWLFEFSKLNDLNIPVLVLVGNHDKLGSIEREGTNSLNVFANKWDNVDIINTPRILWGVAYIPYMRNREKFVEEALKLYQQGATKLLVAHQTFTGATYDNGFYAEDGIDPILIFQESIISGHIHTSQQIDKCFYTGTPKWDTMADANIEKGIWIYTHEDDGTIVDKQSISTKDVVTPIYKIIVNEGDELPVVFENAKTYLEFHGKMAWITKMKKKYDGKACIKAVPKDRKKVSINNGQVVGFPEFLEQHFEPISGVSKQDINKYLRSLDVSR
jgi:Icc-related predicted phosphoesterase